MEKGHQTRYAQRKARRNYRAVLVAAMTAILLLLLASCGGLGSRNSDSSSATVISFEEMPEGTGRGYPAAQPAVRKSASRQIQAGEEAPNFTMTLDDGGALSLTDLQGRPIMLNFWATWCPPCRMEMPDIVTAAAEDDKLIVIAVNVMESQDLVQGFAQEYDMGMTVARDADGKIRDLYQVRGMPTSVFIDREGNIASVWAGMLDAVTLEQRLDEIR